MLNYMKKHYVYLAHNIENNKMYLFCLLYVCNNPDEFGVYGMEVQENSYIETKISTNNRICIEMYFCFEKGKIIKTFDNYDTTESVNHRDLYSVHWLYGSNVLRVVDDNGEYINEIASLVLYLTNEVKQNDKYKEIMSKWKESN